jgi:hypothetical protein
VKDVEPSLGQRAWWALRRGWLLILIAPVTLALIVALAKWLHTLPGPTDEMEATITGFAPEDAPKFGRGEIVTATVAGVYAEADVEVDRLFGCRVGDKIPAKRRGFTVVLQPRPCKH